MRHTAFLLFLLFLFIVNVERCGDLLDYLLQLFLSGERYFAHFYASFFCLYSAVHGLVYSLLYSDSEILRKEVNRHLYPLLAVIKIECLVPACYLVAGRKSVRSAVEHMQFNGYFI